MPGLEVWPGIDRFRCPIRGVRVGLNIPQKMVKNISLKKLFIQSK